MNNETNIVQSKPKTSGKKRAKKAVAFLLVVAILITSAYAFLTAHQTKTNVFTVGNIRLELHEDGWEANSALVNKQYDGTYYNGDDYISSSKLENIIPGEPITKDPMVKNVGKNDARVYMSVSMPQINGADAFTMNNMGANWNLFQTVEKDGYNVYYYHYANVLPANSGNDSNTTYLFQSVTLTDEAYSHMSTEADYSIIINAYGCQTVGEDDWQKAWNKIRTSDPSLDLPEIEILTVGYYNEDMSLFATEQVAAGDPVEMKFDSSLAKQNFSFDWVTDEGEVAYEGMTMPQHSLRLNARYTQLTSEPVSEGIFQFYIDLDENNNPYAKVAYLIDENVNGLDTINVPTEITFISDGSSQFSSTTNDVVYMDPNNASLFSAGNSYTLPVKSVSPFWVNYESINTVVLPDSIINIGGSYSKDSHTQNINIPYGCKSFEGYTLANMTTLNSITIPRSVSEIGRSFLANSHVNTLTISEGVRNANFVLSNMNNGESISGNTIILNNIFEGDSDTAYLGCFNNYVINGDYSAARSLTIWNNDQDRANMPSSVTITINGNLGGQSTQWSTFVMHGSTNPDTQEFVGIDTINVEVNGTLNAFVENNSMVDYYPTQYVITGSGQINNYYTYNPNSYPDGMPNEPDLSGFTGTIVVQGVVDPAQNIFF